MTLKEMKTCYNASEIAKTYNCSRKDAQIIKNLAAFISVHQIDFEQIIDADSEVKLRDFIYNNLNELKHIFK